MQAETIDLCLKKCLSHLDILNKQQLSLPQKSCFNRCHIKFHQAYKYTSEHLSYQNYHIDKTNEEYKKAMENQQLGFLDKLHKAYQDMFPLGGPLGRSTEQKSSSKGE